MLSIGDNWIHGIELERCNFDIAMWELLCGFIIGILVCLGLTSRFSAHQEILKDDHVQLDQVSLASTMYISMEKLESGVPDPKIALERAIELFKYMKAVYSKQGVSGRKWRAAYGVLNKNKLQIYLDSSRASCIHEIDMRRYSVERDSQIPDEELFRKGHAIVLCPRFKSLSIFLYFASGYEKEQWFYMLRRASKSTEENNEFDHGIRLLRQLNTISDPMSWLNVLLGRIFLSFTYNQHFKRLLLERINQKYYTQHSGSILGDITIEDLDMGNSLPIFSDPRVDIDKVGNTVIDFSLLYTGGARLKAKSIISGKIALLGSLSVPIAIVITVNRIEARLRLVIKSLHETNRIWMGVHRNPIISVEIGTEISSKHVQLELINKIVENRIQLALEEYIILPRMDDICFCDYGVLNDNISENNEDESDEDGIVDAYHLLPNSLNS